MLAAFDDEPPARRAPWLVVGVVGVAVLALVAGITYGVRALSGGGAQPAQALPAGAFAFAEMDLDPPAGQKVDAVRFLRQFPALRDKLDGDDLRRTVFEAVAAGAGWSEIDYASQVEPWLGHRLGVALYPADRFGGADAPADGPAVVVALQVTDGEKAREGLARLAAATGTGSTGESPAADRTGFVVAGDYALLTESRALAEKAAGAAAAGSLAESGDFSADMAGLTDGVASAWVDMGAADGLAGLANPLGLGAVGNLGGVATTAGGTGRAAYVLRFDGPDAIEVAGRFHGAEAIEGIGSATLSGFDALPASTVAAFGLAGGEQMVGPMWQALTEQLAATGADTDQMVAEAEREWGIGLPGDLAALLGSNWLLALDKTGLGEGVLQLGARATTDVGRARPVVERMTALLQRMEPGVRSAMTDDGYVVASEPAALRRLADGADESLGDQEAFRRALPDVAEARMALWVDPRPIVTSSAGEVDEDLAPVAGLGMTVSANEDGSGEFRMRLVTD